MGFGWPAQLLAAHFYSGGRRSHGIGASGPLSRAACVTIAAGLTLK